jgi:hypothetical protein
MEREKIFSQFQMEITYVPETRCKCVYVSANYTMFCFYCREEMYNRRLFPMHGPGEEQTCPICLEVMEDHCYTINCCKKTFHLSCLVQIRNDRCPNCRCQGIECASHFEFDDDPIRVARKMIAQGLLKRKLDDV